MRRLSLRFARGFVVLALAVGTPALVSACSALESLDGYAGNANGDAAATIDTGAANDATAADARNQNDSGSTTQDTGSSTDSGGQTPYCASLKPAPLFCDDFDGVDLALKWDEVNSTGGQPARSTDAFTSPPYGLALPVGALAPNDPLWAVLAKTFTALAGKPVRGQASIDIRIDLADTNAGSAAVVWALHYEGTGGVYWELQIVAGYDGSAVSLVVVEVGKDSTTGNFYRQQALRTVQLGEWHRYRVDVTLGRVGTKPLGANTSQVFVDGVPVSTMLLTNTVVSAPPQLYVGTGYVHTPSTPWKIFYDDAMIDLTAM